MNHNDKEIDIEPGVMVLGIAYVSSIFCMIAWLV